MSQSAFYYLQITSTLSILLPLGVGVWKFRAAEFNIKVFVVFLLLGLLTDLAGWYLFLVNDGLTNQWIRFGYTIIETIFFFWFTSQFATSKIIHLIFSNAWMVLLPFWMASIYFARMDVFETTGQVLVAFASSFCVLQMIEKQGSHGAALGLLLGLFFYCFCTFFFTSILSSQLGLKIWFLQNLINITTNLIYLWGLSRDNRAGLTL